MEFIPVRTQKTLTSFYVPVCNHTYIPEQVGTLQVLRYGILFGVKEGRHPETKIFDHFIIEILQLCTKIYAAL